MQLLRVDSSARGRSVTRQLTGPSARRDCGRIRVEARAVNGEVEMTIGNTGDGIPKERAGLLFERFYRVHAGARGPGHGLGLSIARELARAHGGDVELVRSDGSWTEMRVRLPQVA